MFPGGRFVVPFVNTIGNLLKRGVEMTPGVGIAMARGQNPSEVIAKHLSKRDFIVPQIETTDSPYSIAVFQAATDDNPTLNIEVINEIFKQIDDPDALAIRRYGNWD